jgi:etoposide-induced 2.4 mRNA
MSIHPILQEFITGLKHSLNVLKTCETLLKIKETHKPIFFSIFLTGFIFLGSLLTYNILTSILLSDFPKIEKVLSKLYYIFWLIPLHVFCFVVNIFCYSDISSATFKHNGGKTVSVALSFSRGLACEIHRGLMVGVYLLIINLISFVPGSLLPSACLLSWLYSFYCFEYRWMFEGKTIVKEIKTIENNAIYYLGFGLPFALVTICFPGFLGNGIWALLFPFFSVTAILADPPPAASFGLPVFTPVHHLCDKLEVLIFSRTEGKH